ncbi:MAG: hypothetical protein O9320_02365 [Magnetospirillum sp.]|jgi:hypothetical protein|nr:hypothetical protein [Magnetospirillum sp.]
MQRKIKSLALAALVAAALAACSIDDVKNAGQASVRSWCRNAPQICTDHDEKKY